jgi:uncharacterized membrane-anchored protein YjiN (DUF445 family)
MCAWNLIKLYVGGKNMAKRRNNNTRTANLTLGGITLGFLFSYPFHENIIGGLISSGCSAGMIGGLADWFAVTALFRRPLGIRPGKFFRTEIIPQNRERIFVALADMVQHELLSQDVLRSKLSAWDFSGVLIRIFAEQDVRETVNYLLTKLVEDNIHKLDQEEFKLLVQGFLQENWGRLNLSGALAEIIQFSVENGDVDQALSVICQAMYEFVDQSVVSVALMDMMGDALTRYGEKNPARKLVEKLLPSPSVLAQGVQAKVKAAFQDGTVQTWLKGFLLHFVLELKTSPVVQERLNRLILEALARCLENPEIKEKIAVFIGTSPEKPPAMIEWLLAYLRNNWDGYLKRIELNLDLRLKVDEGVKGILEKQIGYHHNAIGRLVREGLETLTDEMLVELIEDKAGNDLQMIRINGSVVGGLVGMIIYVLRVVLR